MRYIETATEGVKLFQAMIDTDLIPSLKGQDADQLAEIFAFDNGGREIRDILVLQSKCDPKNFDAIYTSLGTILARKFAETWNSYATIIQNGYIPQGMKTIREDYDSAVKGQVTAFDANDFKDDHNTITKNGLVRTETTTDKLSLSQFVTLRSIMFEDIRRQILKTTI